MGSDRSRTDIQNDGNSGVTHPEEQSKGLSFRIQQTFLCIQRHLNQRIQRGFFVIYTYLYTSFAVSMSSVAVSDDGMYLS